MTDLQGLLAGLAGMFVFFPITVLVFEWGTRPSTSWTGAAFGLPCVMVTISLALVSTALAVVGAIGLLGGAP